jgi:hypothetical protein
MIAPPQFLEEICRKIVPIRIQIELLPYIQYIRQKNQNIKD